ncbi:hypothetical protein ACFSTD_22475 [Novosphingobium colocasiae]
MPVIDLARASTRELNARLHALTPDDGETEWVVANPQGRHALAVGLDQPVTVEIKGHAGYYCAGMNAEATVIVDGNVGVGVAENMMSGTVLVKGDASQAAGGHGPRRAAGDRRRCLGPLRHLDEGRRYRRQRLDRADERVHGAIG